MPSTAEPTQPASRDELATVYLKGRDVPCPNCNYNRRDATRSKCPECQSPIEIGELQPQQFAISRSHARLIFMAIGLFSLIVAAESMLHMFTTYKLVARTGNLMAMFPWPLIYAWGIVCSITATMVSRRGWANARRPSGKARHAKTLIWSIVLGFGSLTPRAAYELFALYHYLGF